jgi:RES domain-containing protein
MPANGLRMVPDPSRLSEHACPVPPGAFVRCSKLVHRATPLGMSKGKSRFSSPDNRFHLLYVARDLSTAIAEAVVRDRFVTQVERHLTQSDIDIWGACTIESHRALRVLDLRGDSSFQIGISTDIIGAKAHEESQKFSQFIYDSTDFDGIIYPSRLTRRDCIAIYDRAAASALGASPIIELSRLVKLESALNELAIKLVA